MVRTLFYIAIVLLASSCIFDSRLSLVQRENDTSSLRLDGIYLHKDSLDIVDLFFFYEDGTILSRGSIPVDRLEEKLEQLEYSKDENYKKIKYLWGRYVIDVNVIKFEKWAPNDKPYGAFVREGHILNDSSFVMETMYSSEGKDIRSINETYRFRKTTSKPDSLNKWLDKK